MAIEYPLPSSSGPATSGAEAAGRAAATEEAARTALHTDAGAQPSSDHALDAYLGIVVGRLASVPHTSSCMLWMFCAHTRTCTHAPLDTRTRTRTSTRMHHYYRVYTLARARARKHAYCSCPHYARIRHTTQARTHVAFKPLIHDTTTHVLQRRRPSASSTPARTSSSRASPASWASSCWRLCCARARTWGPCLCSSAHAAGQGQPPGRGCSRYSRRTGRD